MYIVDKATPLPSAPPYQPPMQNYPSAYTYATMPYQQQQMYTYYQARPPQYYPPQQQQQMGTGTAIAAGFVMGAVMEDILDPTE
jgi:hypothetical protein